MSDQREHPHQTEPVKTAHDAKEKLKTEDSFGVPVQKSPWLVYALLQIPIVIIMVVILYFMYQQRQN